MQIANNLNSDDQIKRLRVGVLLFFVGVTIPLLLIIYYGFQKFENEVLFQYRLNSSNVLAKVNKTLNERLSREQQRPALDYYYYQESLKDTTSDYLANITPLALDNEPHYLSDLLGLIGHFNVVDKTYFNSPLLPHLDKEKNSAANLRLSEQDIEARLAKVSVVKQVLIENDFLENQDVTTEKRDRFLIAPFTQVGNFKMVETVNQQLIFYRDAQINQQYSVQGFIVDKAVYLHKLIGILIKRGGFSNSVQVQLVNKLDGNFSNFYQLNVSAQSEASILQSNTSNNTLSSRDLFSGDLMAPFQSLALVFKTGELPLGSITQFIILFIVVLGLVIVTGTTGFYWLGVKQIALAEQRMNFVSSVSHELKTPLTSIMMYSEMLKTGMVPDQKHQLNHFNFIFDESERLSRLINNVLQLSSFNRNQEVLNLEPVGVNTLENIIQSKVSTLIAKNNFQLNIVVDEEITPDTKVIVDLDAFSQIVINLVDNAVKFYNAAKINDVTRQKVDVLFKLNDDTKNTLSFSIRDYGPGISNSQLNKIFELFYRCGNEMTRTTPGTGIGLALVHQLVTAQGGEIAVSQQSQGVMFNLTFATHSLN